MTEWNSFGLVCVYITCDTDLKMPRANAYLWPSSTVGEWREKNVRCVHCDKKSNGVCILFGATDNMHSVVCIVEIVKRSKS